MYAILRRMPELSAQRAELEKFFVYFAEAAWESWAKGLYEKQVHDCEVQTSGRYPADLIEKIRAFNESEHTIDLLIEHLRQRKAGAY